MVISKGDRDHGIQKGILGWHDVIVIVIFKQVGSIIVSGRYARYFYEYDYYLYPGYFRTLAKRSL